jgi:hypothetical protein
MSFYIGSRAGRSGESGVTSNILDQMRDKGWISLFMKNWLVFENPEGMFAYVAGVARKGGFAEFRPLLELERKAAATPGSDINIVAAVRELLADSFGPLSPKGPFTYRTLASSWELSTAFDEYCARHLIPSQGFCENHRISEEFLTSTFGEARINPG